MTTCASAEVVRQRWKKNKIFLIASRQCLLDRAVQGELAQTEGLMWATEDLLGCPIQAGHLLTTSGKGAALPQTTWVPSSLKCPLLARSLQEACRKLRAQGSEPAGLSRLLTFSVIMGLSCAPLTLCSQPAKSKINPSCWGPRFINLSTHSSSKWHHLVRTQIHSCSFECVLCQKHYPITFLPALLSFMLFSGVCSSWHWQKMWFTYFCCNWKTKAEGAGRDDSRECWGNFTGCKEC